jgi:hypothetical protein
MNEKIPTFLQDQINKTAKKPLNYGKNGEFNNEGESG